MYHDPKLNGGAYLLTWNPAITKPKDMQWIFDALRKGRNPIADWSLGNTSNVQTGARFFFLLQGSEHAGLVGWGRIRSAMFVTKAWGNEAWISFDCLRKPSEKPFITTEELRTDPRTKAGFWSPRSSGTRISKEMVQGIRNLLGSRGERVPAGTDLPPVPQMTTKQYLENAGRQALLTRHERSAGARDKCIQIYGCRCQACDFDFGLQYGPDADGMIEVHHLNPISQAGKNARVCPKKDLVPLCANCHRAIHMNGKNEEPLTLQKLRALIRKHGNGYGDARS